jgi:hypothetical protein
MSMTISILGGVGGAFWGAVVTLLVQSSSATTMTTIGSRQRGLIDLSAGIGACPWRQCRHHRNWLARRAYRRA